MNFIDFNRTMTVLSLVIDEVVLRNNIGRKDIVVAVMITDREQHVYRHPNILQFRQIYAP